MWKQRLKEASESEPGWYGPRPVQATLSSHRLTLHRLCARTNKVCEGVACPRSNSHSSQWHPEAAAPFTAEEDERPLWAAAEPQLSQLMCHRGKELEWARKGSHASSSPRCSLAYVCKQRHGAGEGHGAKLRCWHIVSESQSQTEHLNEVSAREETFLW